MTVDLAEVLPAETVCYGDLGCYTTAAPWTSSVRPIPALPENPSIINTKFHLFTRLENNFLNEFFLEILIYLPKVQSNIRVRAISWRFRRIIWISI